MIGRRTGWSDHLRRSARGEWPYLFRRPLDDDALRDIRLTLMRPSQRLGNERFYAKIERMAGQRRKARPLVASPDDPVDDASPDRTRYGSHPEEPKLFDGPPADKEGGPSATRRIDG